MGPIIPPDGYMPTRRNITMVSAMTREKRCIGRKGNLLFYLPKDLKNFKETTKDGVVVVGRITHEGIMRQLGKPLPGRDTIILTKQSIVLPERCIACASREHVLEVTSGKDIFIIGGAQIYELFMGDANRMVLTWINAEVPDGDAFFPEIPIDFEPYGTIRRFESEGEDRPSFEIINYKRRPPLVR